MFSLFFAKFNISFENNDTASHYCKLKGPIYYLGIHVVIAFKGKVIAFNINIKHAVSSVKWCSLWQQSHMSWLGDHEQFSSAGDGEPNCDAMQQGCIKTLGIARMHKVYQ